MPRFNGVRLTQKEKASAGRPGSHQADYLSVQRSFPKRVRDYRSKVNINLLAKNAGTNVEILERFYLSRMIPSPEIIAEFRSND